MHTSRDSLVFTLRGDAIERLPSCPGIYRFYSADDTLLYVGKSIDIRSRVSTHFGTAETTRQRRMLAAVTRIDAFPCAGEVGALLRENAAIKREIPLYNRRQRRHRSLWTLTLHEDKDGWLRPLARDTRELPVAGDDTYGLFHSQAQALEALRQSARERSLCLRVLGLEPGRGACFAHQLRRCRGACNGLETPAAHNARLLEALSRRRLRAWPFDGPILLRERAPHAEAPQPRDDWHLVQEWRYLGSFATRGRARRALLRGSAAGDSAAKRDTEGSIPDRDAYAILLRALLRPDIQLFTVSGAPLERPTEATESAA
jgi:hypothetical protein